MGAVNLSSMTFPVLRTPAGSSTMNFGLFVDTAGHDDELARSQLDNPVPELDAKAATPNRKHLVDVIMVVPRKCSLHPDQLDLLAVQLGDDLGPPPLREASKLFGDVDAFYPLRALSAHYAT
jgi:hypothetical protein